MKRSAFSLVELSIVLVILGLLTGGVLTGQNLIRAAELRAITTEFNSYQTAIMSFRDKYLALPGDITNATSFWGEMTSGTCPNATGGTGTQTCNGNGEGKINWPSGNASETAEIYLFWQHLSNAGLIEGSYTGLAGPNSKTDSRIAENVPRSKLTNAGWSAAWHETATSHFDNILDRNIMVVGGQATAGVTSAPILNPTEQWGIDKKIDDGLPAKGTVIHVNATAGSLCTTAGGDTADFDATYKLDEDGIVCAPWFRNTF